MEHGLIIKGRTATLSRFMKGIPELNRSIIASYPQKCKDTPNVEGSSKCTALHSGSKQENKYKGCNYETPVIKTPRHSAVFHHSNLSSLALESVSVPQVI